MAIFSLADIYFYRGDIDNSLDLYRKYVSLNPDNGNLLLERARWLRREQQPEMAIKLYNLVTELFPNTNAYLDSMMSIGELKAELNQPKEAIDILQQMITIAKNTNNRTTKNQLASAQIMIGDIYQKDMHNLPSALTEYKKAESIIDPRSEQISDLRLKITDCYRLMGFYDEALETLNSIPKESRSASIEAHIAKMKGDCYFSMGDFDGAKIQYKVATKRNLNEDWANDALDRLALMDEYSNGSLRDLLKTYDSIERLTASGEYDNAFLECSNAVKKYPANDLTDRIQIDMGELLILKGKYNDAIKTYEGLIRPDSQFAAEAQFRIANIYWQRLNDRQQAIDAYSKLIREYPDSILVADARKQLQRLSANGTNSEQALP
jgi:tetratricopeptide (TPR) repeat protein